MVDTQALRCGNRQHSRSARPAVVYDAFVIKRFYVHNFRCLENFELPVSGLSSALLIGNNGSGKTTVGLALEILQRIARGTNRVRELAKPKDLSRGRADVPMRFEIEVEVEARTYGYVIAFELPVGATELRVFEEQLTVDGKPVYSREMAQVHLAKSDQAKEAGFPVDWNLVALPIVQQGSAKDPLSAFTQWLARMLILRPVPSLILGESRGTTLLVDARATNFATWFSALVAYRPSAYAKMHEYLKQLMPDLGEIRNLGVGRDYQNLVVQFSNDQGSVVLPFDDLSDGEKCFMICAMVLAANEAYGPLLCFWDEPESHLALSEVGHFVMALRKAFQSGGQFIATSHNPEAIRSFSDQNTLVFSRRNHLEPTIVRRLTELRASGDFSGDLIGALVRGDLEP
jgi:predicted ATPase